MPENLSDAVNAIGVLAESSLLYYRILIQNGATAEEAKILTLNYLTAMIHGRKEEI